MNGPEGGGGETPRAAEASVFVVDMPGYSGPLEGLVIRAQRGDVDLADIPVSQITRDYRAHLAQADPRPEAREVADFLSLAARLVALKAARMVPDGPLNFEEEGADGEGPVDEDGAGKRLAEYRLFRAAAEALLSDAAEEGARSFLGMVSAEVVPAERLNIAPERLAAAFRAVLERLADLDPLPVGTATFSVAEKVAGLRELLEQRGTVAFEEIFEGVESRLEAVACFLALLELLRDGLATVQQTEAFGGIRVSAGE
jgi:segregation and condensation protein A